ncbi:ABC transporter permease [Natronoglomus mannanivorans]|uniref:ABC transporter permease n=1 Tax=Natronoglomus mannanivorans TaxID=2979990 RepID=A0AAP2Z2I6_9EURY|nr:ABC transporter permease [Halobacteria archaeon AArc-xg1-1]
MNYYLRRLWQAVFTLFVVIALTFVLYRMMPGGPIEQMQQRMVDDAVGSGQQPDLEYINRMVEIRTGIDPDTPMYIQFYEYMRDIILYQDFGESITHGDPVFDILFYAMPWSIFVSIYGLLIGFTANIVLGAVMAYYEGSRFDSGSTVVAVVLNSIPYYVGAVIMLAFLSFQWELFPTGGRYWASTEPGFTIEFALGVLHHGALPIMSTILIGFGGTALSMRGNCIRVMGSNYLRVARLRGLSDSRIATRYVGRNAILPLYTGFMIGLAGIFGSSIIMEQIFTYPGVGWYTFDALTQRDYPLLMGILIFFSTITVIGVLIADMTYGLIDPRASTSDKEGF